MKSKKLKKSILVAFTSLSVLAIATPFLPFWAQGAITGNAELAEIKGEFTESYVYGTNFVSPEVKLSYNGKEYETENTVVYYPNGEASTADSCYLDVYGTYTVVYSATVDGVKLKGEKQFSVKRGLYEVSSVASSVSQTAETLVLPQEEKKGLKVSIADGDKFTFNQPIDLNTLNGQSIVDFYTYSCNYNQGMHLRSEVSDMFITLTDCYDADNYVEFQIVYANDQGAKYAYYRAGANGASAAGLEVNDVNAGTPAESILEISTQSDRKEVFIDGVRHVARFETYGTTSTGRKLTDENGENVLDANGKVVWVGWDKGFSLSYDNAENRIYLKDGIEHLVSDLDEPTLFPSGMFKGFTTGEVYLSVHGSSYYENSMNLEITSLGGIAGEALVLGELTDDTAPTIKVVAEKDGYVIAKGEKFCPFEATVEDVNAIGSVEKTLYYNYGTPAEVNISLEKDGSFTPALVGEYTIVYSARDSYGNVSQKLIRLNSVEKTSGQLVELTTEKLKTLTAGEQATLPAYACKSPNGGEFVRIRAVFEDGTATEIDGKTRSFVPVGAGEYTIAYEYGDDVQSYVYEYSIVATASDEVKYPKKPTLPTYFIKGATYTLDKFYAYTFDEKSPTAHLAELSVSFDGGKFQAADFDELTVSAKNTVALKYAYEGIAYEEIVEIPVVDVGFESQLDFSKYFVGDFTIEGKSNAISLKSNQLLGKNSFEFINPVSLNGFRFKFNIPAELSNFKSLTITIADYYDRDKTVAFTYKNVNGFMVIAMNGAQETWKKTISFADSVMELYYNASLQQFVAASGTAFKLPYAFSSDKILVEVGLDGLTGNGGVEIQQIGNQMLAGELGDYTNPILDVAQSCGTYELNETVIVYQLNAIDIAGPIALKDITVSVKSPSNTAVVSEDGVLLDGTNPADREYRIKLTEYGSYRVYYTVIDQNYNEYKFNYPITVSDKTAPTITISGGYGENKSATAKYATKVKVAEYSVADDVSGKEKLVSFVTVFDPTGKIYILKEKTFNADRKGVWTVCYNCYDEAGNYTMCSYQIEVK